MPCKYEYKCDHKKLSMVICMEENNQPPENCYLYVLMEDVEKQKAKKPRRNPMDCPLIDSCLFHLTHSNVCEMYRDKFYQSCRFYQLTKKENLELQKKVREADKLKK